MVKYSGGIKPQIKLRLRKKNKNIVLENIDKYNKSKLLKLLSDCYLDMEVLSVYQGEIDDDGEPVNSQDYFTWGNNHPNDIPENLYKIVATLLNNGIYPKLCYTYGVDYEKTSFISNLITFTFNKDFGSIELEYFTVDMLSDVRPIMKRIVLILTPIIDFNSGQISTITDKITPR